MDQNNIPLLINTDTDHNYTGHPSPDQSPLMHPSRATTMYGDPLSPRLTLKAIGTEYQPQEREKFYRNTQPSFNIQIEKVQRRSRHNVNETPKHEADQSQQPSKKKT